MRKKKQYIFLLLFATLLFAACNNKKKEVEKGEDMPGMPGMKMSDANAANNSNSEIDTNKLKDLLRPTTQFVVSQLPVTTLEQSSDAMELEVLGSVEYDNRQIHTLSSRIAGRIEKLYVRYRYQYVSKGQKVLEIYSPELLTSQQNLIFISRSDAGNQSLISAAKQRLLLLGMSGQQVAQIIRTGKPLYSVTVFSPYSGYITEPGFAQNMNNGNNNVMQGNGNNNGTREENNNTTATTTSELPVKEGMYVDKAQTIFTLINASRGRISLSLFGSQQNQVKAGTPVMIIPETAPAKKFRAKIDLIEPFYRPGSKTLSARVYFNNADLLLPIGSQVRGTIFIPEQTGYWLPVSAVITTGLNNVVFKKEGPGFSPKVVTTGLRNKDRIEIVSGLSLSDSVAINAQHLTESESIINVKQSP